MEGYAARAAVEKGERWRMLSRVVPADTLFAGHRTPNRWSFEMPIFTVYADTEALLRSGRGQVALTSTQAAARLGVPERRIRQFVNDAQLTPCPEKFGCSPLYLESDVMQLLESRKKSHY
ncbi:MAG: hypothetical protein WAV09_03020 [Minisyncoccia bacterium]